ncbi:hypothetical protein ACFOWA_06770 [Pedobacter lithocola]|uniref:Uncharacterized protein n=1 Tax=Pedobacter lithocola TaxID=1908239 RepID=A0ABV8P9K7_9SPHI
MEIIFTETQYKQVVNRIAALSALQNYNNSESEELKHLSKLAMAYEYQKYDFSLKINGSFQNPSAQQL